MTSIDSKITLVPPTRPDRTDGAVGAVDMGSKNFKFVFGQQVDGVVTTALIGKERLELGREVTENDGLIGEQKILQMQEAIGWFVRYCSDRGAPLVLAIATSAIRNAKNHQRVIDMAREAGLTIDVAEGTREGEVGYFAATGGAPDMLVCEAGSKSMQIAWEAEGKIHARSVPVGYQLAYEGFFEPASGLREAQQRFRRFLDGNFTQLPEGLSRLVALAANTLTSFVIGEDRQTPHRTLTKAGLNDRLSELKMFSEARYAELKASLPGAEKVLPGLVFLDYVMERGGYGEALISENELPVGLIVEYFLKR
jgi:exopolyphosphatase/pppGpp-phosphohydrolase